MFLIDRKMPQIDEIYLIFTGNILFLIKRRKVREMKHEAVYASQNMYRKCEKCVLKKSIQTIHSKLG